MQVLRDPALVESVQEPGIRQLLAQRFEDICQGETYETDIHGYFVLVESGDRVADIEAESGCPILRGVLGDTRYGDPGFSPSFEVLEEHVTCFELVFIASDGDFGIVVLVPKLPGVDSELLRFCRQYATPEPGLVLTDRES